MIPLEGAASSRHDSLIEAHTMATVRQIAANRQNAQLSTGPRTDEGKERSRANALKHGLAGAGVVLAFDDAEIVAERMETWQRDYQPRTPEDAWLFEQLVVTTVRVDRCVLEELFLRGEEVNRADLCWENERRLAAEDLASRLAKRPGPTARRLLKTKQGCDWLLDRWRALGEIVARGEEWTEPQKSLALDLLGIPLQVRNVLPWCEGESLAAFVAQQIEALEAAKAGALDVIDQRECKAARRGIAAEPSRQIALLRRYEAACLRRYEWVRGLLHDARRKRSEQAKVEAQPEGVAQPETVAPAAAPPATACEPARDEAYVVDMAMVPRAASPAEASPSVTAVANGNGHTHAHNAGAPAQQAPALAHAAAAAPRPVRPLNRKQRIREQKLQARRAAALAAIR
jgi:hypothetical protein